MRTNQIIKNLEKGKAEGKEFIKWWRKENDFTDYELVDSFLSSAESKHNIENYQLLDKDEMWEILKRWNPKGLRRSKATRSDKIEWQHLDKDGQKKTDTCPYNAENIMAIFEAETHGDTVG